MTGAIIPTLMHRNQSKLRSQACSSESSTEMGELLGSPRVAPLFPFCRRNFSHIYIYIYIYIWNLFDLHPYFPVGCRAKVRKLFRMASRVRELVGPIGGRESCIG